MLRILPFPGQVEDARHLPAAAEKDAVARPVAVLSRVGLVSVTCDIHPGMHAYVVVTRAPYAARTAADGNFELRDVAPGRYRARVWRVPAGVAFTDTGREVGAVVRTVDVGAGDIAISLP